MRSLLITACLLGLAGHAQASHHTAQSAITTCDDRGCRGTAATMPRQRPQIAAHGRLRQTAPRQRPFHSDEPARGGASLAGLPGPLVAKVEEISRDCPGMHAISTFRPGARIAGTNRASLHGFHKAADVAGGSFACAYAHLGSDWPGGASIDAARMGHIHISWNPGGAEWGARFNHGGGHHYGGAYARARTGHRRRYARR